MAIISAGVVLAFFGIFLRLFFLQVVKGEEYKKMEKNNIRASIRCWQKEEELFQMTEKF